MKKKTNKISIRITTIQYTFVNIKTRVKSNINYFFSLNYVRVCDFIYD